MSVFRITFLFIVFSVSGIHGDDYHNVNGFFGERAAGLGGAYTAISDDPSGAFYNPAGIAFAYDNFISISASNYRETKKAYLNVFGPGQSYSRTSRSYVPNFFGALKQFGDWHFGFSIATPATDDYDQADQIQYPLSLNRVAFFKNDYTEKNTSLLAGPSLAHTLGKKLAFGATLYYFYDSSRITTSQLASRKDGTYVQTDLTDRRRTMGVTPVLGLQFMPVDFLSLGASLRRPFVTATERRKAGIINDTAKTSSALTFLESTTNSSAAANSGSAIVGAPETGSIPEVIEARAGAAMFISRYAMLSADVIVTGGYSEERDRTQADVNGNVYLNSREVQALARVPTTNFAAGAEYYITDNFSLRAGAYTNQANSNKIQWLDGMIAASARNSGRNSVSIPLNGGSQLVYNIPGTESLERFEHVDTHGYTLGVSWGDARSSLTITYQRETGKGAAQIDQSQAPQSLKFRGSSIYIVASTRS